MHELTDKIIIITGGAGLLGSQFVEAVLMNHGSAVIADVNIDSAKLCESKLSAKFPEGSIDSVSVDITSKSSIESLITFIHGKYGKIDALVNNAYPRNKNYGRHFLDVEYGDLCENLNLHLGGYFLTSQQMIKYFLKQGYGNIINIASVYGVIPPRFEIYEGTSMTMPVEYAMIKSGVIHYTKYIAKLMKGKNIRVNCISPGGILDNQPVRFIEGYKSFSLNKGMLHKEDLNGTLTFLLSDNSSSINGQNIIVDDGFSL